MVSTASSQVGAQGLTLDLHRQGQPSVPVALAVAGAVAPAAAAAAVCMDAVLLFASLAAVNEPELCISRWLKLVPLGDTKLELRRDAVVLMLHSVSRQSVCTYVKQW